MTAVPNPTSLRARWTTWLCALLLAACGGSGDTPAPSAVTPTITTQPAALAVMDGQPATFTVAATGTAPLAYQWQRGGAALPGAIGASLTLPATGLADDAASFRVVVSNAAGSVTSNAATLTVNARPVMLSQQPQSMTIAELNTVTLALTAEGSAPITYQWQRSADGTTWADIAGAVAADYTTPRLSRADSGVRYRVLVNNPANLTAQSGAAQITVTPDAAVLAAAGGTVSGDNDNIRIEVEPGALLGATRFTFTPLAGLADVPANYTLIAGSAYDIVTDGAGFVTGAMVNVTLRAAAVTSTAIAKAGSSHALEYRVIRFNPVPQNGAVVRCAGNLPAQVLLDGNGNLRSQLCPPPSPRTPSTTTVGATRPVPSVLPRITSQPASREARVGDAVTFSVSASGPGPLSYSWGRNGLAIGTGDTLTIASVSAADIGASFQVRVSNSYGYENSVVATLTAPRPMVWSAPTVAVDYGAEVDVPSAGASFFGAGVVIDNGTLRLLDVTPAPPYVPLTGVARARPVAVGGLNSLLHAVLFATNTTGSTCFGGNRLNAIAIREGSEGGTWASPPVPLFTAAGIDCIFSIAGAHGPRGFEFAVTDSSGQLTVGAFNINYNIAAATWSTPVVASAPLVLPSACEFPSLDRDSMGAAWDSIVGGMPPRIAVLAFNGGIGAVRSTCAATRAADGSWSAAAPVWNNGTDAAGAPVFAEPAVAMDLAGNVLLAGSRGTANGDQLATAYLPAAASVWQVEPALPAFGVALPSLGFDANGNAMLLYRTRPAAAATFTTVYSARRLVSGQWQPRQRVMDADVDTRLPRLSMTFTGDALALFSADAGGQFQVHAARYSNGNWRTAGPVQPTGSPEGRFAVAARYFVNASVSGGFTGLRAYWRETDPAGSGQARIVRAEILSQ